MIPGLDGFEVCKELKKASETRHIPVIMLTARGEEIDRIVGLELGADDYVVKPFSPRELILRIRAVSEGRPGKGRWNHSSKGRAPSGPRSPQGLGGRTGSDAHGHGIQAPGRAPSPAGKVHTRDQLLDKVWGYQFEGYARTVDTHVRRLRQKLGPYSDAVETVRGWGTV